MQRPKANWTKPWWKPMLIGVCVVLGLAQLIGSAVLYFSTEVRAATCHNSRPPSGDVD